jgi:predicted dithiol-disulfide oxidoreductase (DUF899 family)
MNLPEVVSQEEWDKAREELLAKEKAHMKESDALAAERRRLPMVRIDKDYEFEGPEGRVSLLDLFDGRSQLLLYHFMYGPSADHGCDGCSMVIDQLTPLPHIHARDTSFVAVSRAPLPKLEAFKRRMGWEIPWYSWEGTDFGVDFGTSPPEPRSDEYQDGEMFGLSVFIRDGDDIYRTYFTDRRALETIGPVWSLLDLTPLGRQEEWEDSPDGRPQGPPYGWWNLHDEYPEQSEAPSAN